MTARAKLSNALRKAILALNTGKDWRAAVTCLEQVADKLVNTEREACAQICEKYSNWAMAEEIRARSEAK